MTKLIRKRICLEPKHLDQNIYDHLLDKIKVQTENECSKEHGYILNIIKITQLVDNKVSPANSDIVCTVEFEAETMKPEIDKIMKGQVCMILATGILLDINNKLKVLVTSTSLQNYNFKLDKVQMCYINDEKTKLCIDDYIEVKITGVRYSKQKFSCFGDMVAMNLKNKTSE